MMEEELNIVSMYTARGRWKAQNVGIYPLYPGSLCKNVGIYVGIMGMPVKWLSSFHYFHVNGNSFFLLPTHKRAPVRGKITWTTHFNKF